MAHPNPVDTSWVAALLLARTRCDNSWIVGKNEAANFAGCPGIHDAERVL